MALILAIEPDRRQAAQLTSLVRTRVRADLVLAETTEGALGAIGNRVPDLILVPTLLSPQDDAALAGALRVIATAAHVNMLTIPVLADTVAPPKQTGLFARFRKQPEPVSTGCDPSVFAEQIKTYLAEAAAEEDADEFEEAPTQEVPAQETEESGYDAFPEITDARTLRQMLEAPSAPVEKPAPLRVVPPPEPKVVIEPPVVIEAPAAMARPAVVERPVVVEQPLMAQPPADVEEPVIIEPHRLVAPAFVRRPAAAEKPIVEPSIVKPVEPPVVTPPLIIEEPVVVAPVIERQVEEPVAYEPPPQAIYAQPIDTPSLQAIAEQIAVPIEEPVARVTEDVTPAFAHAEPVIAEAAPVIEEVEAFIEQFTPPMVAAAAPPPIERVIAPSVREPVAPPVQETVEDEDPIVLAIKHYVPKPLPEAAPVAPVKRAPEPVRGPLRERVQEPRREHVREPVRPPVGEPIAAAPEPVVPAVRETTFEEIVAEPGLTQSDLDMLYFVEKGTLPPTAPPPRRKKPQRPEWGELVAAVRVDVERMRAEGTEPAKRGQSGVRQAVGSTAPVRKTPKPIQDQWGLFDPEQCGFAALLAKLEEITEAPKDASAQV